MALPALPILLAKAYVIGKGAYTVYNGWHSGWDPKEMLKKSIRDAFATFGTGTRGIRLVTKLYQLYGCQSVNHATKRLTELEALIAAIAADGSLAERQLAAARRLQDRLPWFATIAYRAAGYRMALEPTHKLDGAESFISETLTGLYLYGKLGRQLTEKERTTVILNLIPHLEAAKYHDAKSALQQFQPEVIDGVVEVIRDLPATFHICKRFADSSPDEWIVIGLGGVMTRVLDEATGSKLYERLKAESAA